MKNRMRRVAVGLAVAAAAALGVTGAAYAEPGSAKIHGTVSKTEAWGPCWYCKPGVI